MPDAAGKSKPPIPCKPYIEQVADDLWGLVLQADEGVDADDLAVALRDIANRLSPPDPLSVKPKSRLPKRIIRIDPPAASPA